MQGLGDDHRNVSGTRVAKMLRADLGLICLAVGHKRRYVAFPDAQNPTVIHDHGWQCETCGKAI